MLNSGLLGTDEKLAILRKIVHAGMQRKIQGAHSIQVRDLEHAATASTSNNRMKTQGSVRLVTSVCLVQPSDLKGTVDPSSPERKVTGSGPVSVEKRRNGLSIILPELTPFALSVCTCRLLARVSACSLACRLIFRCMSLFNRAKTGKECWSESWLSQMPSYRPTHRPR